MTKELNDYSIVKIPRRLRHLTSLKETVLHDLRYLRAYARYIQPRIYPPSRVRNKLHSSELLKQALQCANNKAARKLLLALNHDGFRRTSTDNFVSLEFNGMMSFVPKCNEDATDWPNKARTKMRVGRFLRRIAKPWFLSDLSDADLNELATQLKAHTAKLKGCVQLLPIDEAYNWTPTIVSSCMQEAPVGPFYRAIGVNQCVAVVVKGTLCGRALLWESPTIIPGCNGFVDRIYGDDTVRWLLRDWARENGFAYRQEKTLNKYVLPDRTTAEVDVIWHAPFPNVEFYPYVDTLNSYSFKHKAFGTPKTFPDHDYYLQNTDGKL